MVRVIKSSIKQRVKRLLSKLTGQHNGSLNMFIHIPKTAGTSFRGSLEKEHNVICDYGEGKPHTSEQVNELIYKKNDAFALKEAMSKEDAWLCGHMHISKYLSIVSPQNIITFVREPTARVISHFNHELRWGNSTLSLESFLSSRNSNNSQHRFLQGLPLSLIGTVGITEQYAQSLELICSETGISVSEERFNENNQKVSGIEDIDALQLANIKQQNTLDQDIYNKATTILSERLHFLRNNLPWTYIHAEFISDTTISGIAYRRDDTRPVELVVEVENQPDAKVVASELTPLFNHVAFPRERHVGFTVDLLNTQPINQVRLKVIDTQQTYTVFVSPT